MNPLRSNRKLYIPFYLNHSPTSLVEGDTFSSSYVNTFQGTPIHMVGGGGGGGKTWFFFKSRAAIFCCCCCLFNVLGGKYQKRTINIHKKIVLKSRDTSSSLRIGATASDLSNFLWYFFDLFWLPISSRSRRHCKEAYLLELSYIFSIIGWRRDFFM